MQTAAIAATGPSIIDDVPQPLSDKGRTDSQRDHIEAVALFSAGRMHERQEEYAEALRCYERAFRHDPASLSIARAIVPAAVQLKRYSEAIRYAMKAAELEDADSALLRRLGGYLAEEGDWPKAAVLYEKALAARKNEKDATGDILLRMELGRIYCLLDNYKQAADCFAKVLHAADHPGEFGLDESMVKVLLGKQGPTYQLIGECFLAADRPKEATAAFEKADKIAPDKALSKYNLARVCIKTGKPAEALAALESAFAEHLGNEGASPYELFAEILDRLGKKNELVERLEKLRGQDAKNLPLGYFLVAQYQADGKLDKAESLCRDLIKGKPLLAGYRRLAQIHRQQKKFEALLSALGEALETSNLLEVMNAEAQTISGDAETMRGVVDTARAKLKSEPEKFTTGMRLAAAMLALEAKQYDAAGEFFDSALAAKPKQSAEALMVWGVGLLMGERPAEAAKVFQRGVDQKVLPDDNPAFYFYLSGALAMDRRIDEALAAARTAAGRKKDSARYRGREAWVLYVGKRHKDAARAYRDLISECAEDYASTETRDVLREAKIVLSNIAVEAGDNAQAEEWLEQVLDEFPDDVGALNDLGFLWADQNKKLARARRMIEQAVAAEPENAAYRDSLGWVLFRLGKYSEAATELEKAAAGPKPDGVVMDHLGDAYDKLDRPDKAKEAWRKAVGLLRAENEPEKAAIVENKLAK